MRLDLLKNILCSLITTLCTLGFGIENSIIAELDAKKYMNQYRDKFSDRQYREVEDAMEAPCKLRMMSYNVLSKYYDERQKEEYRWENRKSRIVELIVNDSPDILCCQELTTQQISDLIESLGHEYDVYAPLPSDESFADFELLGIFYKKHRFILKQGEKKELGKMYYWELFKHDCFQYYIKGLFLDKGSGKEFVVYNTHADFLKPNVRLQLVDFLLEDAEKEALSYPAIIAGDFNTLPNSLPDPYNSPLTPGIDGNYVLQTLTKKAFRNTLDLTLIAHFGPMSTFTYQVENPTPFSGLDAFGLILDHIFVTPGKIKVLFHAIEPATIDGYFSSDHVPVIADLSIQ
jgi:endonuclease/exonuclease/phosphatase family metal-dependent hydrolase